MRMEIGGLDIGTEDRSLEDIDEDDIKKACARKSHSRVLRGFSLLDTVGTHWGKSRLPQVKRILDNENKDRDTICALYEAWDDEKMHQCPDQGWNRYPPTEETAFEGPIIVGTKVYARWGRNGRMYPATVTHDGDDGTFNIEWDDGESRHTRNRVAADLIPRPNRAAVQKALANLRVSIGSERKIEIGDKVWARWAGAGTGNARWFVAKVVKIYGTGEMKVTWADGSAPSIKKPEEVQPFENPTFQPGEEVDIDGEVHPVVGDQGDGAIRLGSSLHE